MAANTTTTTKTDAPKAKAPAPAKRTRKAAPKAPAKAKAAPKAKAVVKAAPVRRPNRSDAEWDQIALKEIVPALQRGTKMMDIRAKYGAGPTIRRALDRIGFNTKGEKVDKVAIKATGAALAKRVAKRREAGAAWWRLEHETGKSQDDLKALLVKHGQLKLATGRVVISTRGKKVAAKA